MKKLKYIISLLAVTLIGNFLLIPVSAQETVTLEIPARGYLESEVETSILKYITLQPENPDYQDVICQQQNLQQQINQLFLEYLSEPLTLTDVENAEYYKIYYTNENIYDIKNTEDLLETLESGYSSWECYIPAGDNFLIVTLNWNTVSPSKDTGYWGISSVGLISEAERNGYQSAVQAGFNASSGEHQLAFLVSNGCGDIVCLLCSHTVDIMTTVTASQITGNSEFISQIVLPNTQPEDGVFDFQQVATHSESFIPQIDPAQAELWTGPQPSPGIVQRQNGDWNIFLWCAAGAAVVAIGVTGVLVWKHKKKQK